MSRLTARYKFPGWHQPHRKIITASQTWEVPSRIAEGLLLVSGCAAGGGGCSGAVWIAAVPMLAYNYGGSGAAALIRYPLQVVAGDTLTLTLGAPGAGGAAVTRSTGGTTDGNPGGDADPTTIAGTNISITIPGGVGAAWAAAVTPGATWDHAVDGCCDGGQSSASLSCGVGPYSGGAEGTDDAYHTSGGHGGGASAFGNGGDGADGAESTGSGQIITADAGGDGKGYGSGGGGGGGAYNGWGGYSTTSGKGGDGAPAILIFEWWEPVL